MSVGNVNQYWSGLRHRNGHRRNARLDMEKAKYPAVSAEFEKVLKRLEGAFAAVVLTMSLALTSSPSEASGSA